MMLMIVLSIFSFFSCALADQASSKNAERVLNMVAYTLPSPSIIAIFFIMGGFFKCLQPVFRMILFLPLYLVNNQYRHSRLTGRFFYMG